MIINAQNRIPIKCWATNLEEGAWEQLYNLANLPFAFHHIAIAPDGHVGYGMPIGGVLATTDVVVPNAVGVDIGCGMIAVKSNYHIDNLSSDTLKKIMSEVRKQVPIGFNKHFKRNAEAMPTPDGMTAFNYKIVDKEFENAEKSIGTLGGGNHFIEFQKDTAGYLWIMIHSGSRNLGKQVADYYNDVAKELNSKYFSAVPKKWNLAFLPLDSKKGQEYLLEMRYCVDFALANRMEMMRVIKGIVSDELNAAILVRKSLSYQSSQPSYA